MPNASELEEFGLEVEQEEESHALISNSDGKSSGAKNNMNAAADNNSHKFASFPNSSKHHRLESQYTPSKEQRSLLESTNVRYTKLLLNTRTRPFKWPLIILLVVTIIVLFNMGEEETIEKVIIPEDTEIKGNEKSYQLLRPKTKDKVSQPPPPEPDNAHDGAHDDTHDDADAQEGSKEAAQEKKSNSFTLERLLATREAANDLITMLELYYNGEEQSKNMMLESWLLPWDFDPQTNDTDKLIMKNKLVDTMARALVTNDQHEFIIGTIGSSVAAGHDNCNYDSYERQMERTLGPVWEKAGMKLVCQNAGEGGGCGDDFSNQVFCIKQNVSPNIDIAHYSWTYFEVGSEKALESRENLVRWAQMLPRQPPLHVFNAFELPGRTYLPANSDSPGSMMEYELARYYAKYGYNAFYMRSGFVKGGHDYTTDFENGVDHFQAGHVGDGYHNVTRYGENEEDPNRRASLGVVMRNWHPGPLAFQLVADSFSYLYAKAILEALELIEGDLNSDKDPLDTWSAKKRHVLLKTSLPEPKICDPLYCVVDEAPTCINYERPTYGWWGAKVEDPNSNFNPHKGDVQNWEIWLDGQEKDLWHMVPKQDQAFFEDRDDKEICRHLDACGGISATSKESGTVVFKLPKQEVGLVVVCGCCGKDVATKMFLNNADIEIKYNGQTLDPKTWDVYPNEKCVRLLKNFGVAPAAAAPTGHNYLAIKALDNMTEPVRISHLITL